MRQPCSACPCAWGSAHLHVVLVCVRLQVLVLLRLRHQWVCRPRRREDAAGRSRSRGRSCRVLLVGWGSGCGHTCRFSRQAAPERTRFGLGAQLLRSQVAAGAAQCLRCRGEHNVNGTCSSLQASTVPSKTTACDQPDVVWSALSEHHAEAGPGQLREVAWRATRSSRTSLNATVPANLPHCTSACKLLGFAQRPCL